MAVWIAFIAFVVLALILDLGVFNKSPHVIKTKEAAIWTGLWIFCALAFAGIVYLSFKHHWVSNPTGITPYTAVIKFVTGYLIELSLSIDNIFVIALIFSSFSIPKMYQHEVLFYGILGAIVFRALMITFGISLINRFDWIVYVFGVFLIFTAIKMLLNKDKKIDPKSSKLFKWLSKIYPVTHEINNDKFFVRKNGVRYMTPLFVALIIIEFTDIFFAIDSIPAILAITSDPLVVFSSNIFAIMGLRSMFFLISGMLDKFHYISYSLVIILGFVGVKMLLSHFIVIPEWASLAVISLALAGGIAGSLLVKKE